MIINKSGVTIRMKVEELRVMGRATQGVRLIRLDDDDEIASVAKVEVDDDEKVVLPVQDVENPDAIKPNDSPDPEASDAENTTPDLT